MQRWGVCVIKIKIHTGFKQTQQENKLRTNSSLSTDKIEK